MPSPFPGRPAPGGVPADLLARVDEVHAVCREWTAGFPQQLPYTDLAFAFGFALLGDPARARRLLADGRKSLEAPTVRAEKRRQDPATVASVVGGFLLRAFEYRIDRALTGQPHTGSLSPELFAALNEIGRAADERPVNNSHKLAMHAITLFRKVSRILEPDDRIDPYSEWANGDPVTREFAELQTMWEPDELADRIRRVYRTAAAGENPEQGRLQVLIQSLPLALRVTEAFAAELLELVLSLLPELPEVDERAWGSIAVREGRLLDEAFSVAPRIGRRDLARRLDELFTGQMSGLPTKPRLELINATGWSCLRCLRVLGLRAETERLLARLNTAVPDARPATVGAYLQARCVVATGWLMLGSDTRAAPLLDEVWHELCVPDAVILRPMEYAELAQGYVSALGQGPVDSGLTRVAELFREMPPGRLTTAFTTAPYFSRLHVRLTEDVVTAICWMLLEPRS